MSEKTGGDEQPPVRRGEGGKFLRGTRGGPGRQRKRPLRDVVTYEVEADLWRAHLDDAQQPGDDGRAAREFVLRHVAGTPYQAVPDVPPLMWPAVMSVDDLGQCVGVVLTAHREGQIDTAGMTHLVDVITKLAKVFEAVDLLPKLRKLEEHVAAIGGGM